LRVVDKIFLFILIAFIALVFAYLAWGSLTSRPLSPEELRQMSENVPKDTWELAPKNAHPIAAKLLNDKFYWDCTDDDSPFGNDDGAEALRLYRNWRTEDPDGKPVQFIEELLPRWQASLSQWKTISPANAGSILFAGNGYVLSTGDQVIISVAFGQLLLDGHIDSDLRSLALEAIEREKNPHILSHWVVPDERKTRLNKMQAILRTL
jgi:uncharacterized protein YfeS